MCPNPKDGERASLPPQKGPLEAASGIFLGSDEASVETSYWQGCAGGSLQPLILGGGGDCGRDEFLLLKNKELGCVSECRPSKAAPGEAAFLGRLWVSLAKAQVLGNRSSASHRRATSERSQPC